MARQRAARPPAQRLILDAGALIALARRDVRAKAALTSAWELGVEVVVPAVVVAETTRGSVRDAPLNQVLHAVGEVTPVDEASARLAGAMLGRAKSSETIDALVVAAAVAVGGGVVLTGDVEDLAALAAGHPEVVLKPL